MSAFEGPSPTLVSQTTFPRLSGLTVLSEPEKAWLAGVVDSEGSIYFIHGKDARGWALRQTVIDVVNTDARFARRIQQVMGGSLRVQIRSPNRKPLYKIELKPHERVHSVLTQILPYLIIKKQRAEETIAFIESISWKRAPFKDRSADIRKSWATRRKRYPPSGMPSGWKKRP